MRWELHVRFCERPEGKAPSGLLDRPSRCCCREIKRRKPGGCGRTFVMTATPGQRAAAVAHQTTCGITLIINTVLGIRLLMFLTARSYKSQQERGKLTKVYKQSRFMHFQHIQVSDATGANQ